jgi:ABC-2 type transport system ATP-binding protein
MTLLQAKGISKKFHSEEILKLSNLSIKKGDICGVIGPSGSGKTTLLRLILRLYQPSSGEILYNGNNIEKISGYTKNIGVSFQECSLYDDLTVAENLFYFGKLYGLSKKTIDKDTKKLLNLVGLKGKEKKQICELSGGMKRRLDLACSILHSPQILVLDEPMQGLDPLLRRHMWELIRTINKMGMTVIISSHLLNEIEHICNYLIVLKEGKIIVEGTPEEVKTKYTLNEEIHLETYPGNYKKIISKLSTLDMISSCKIKEHKIVIYTNEAEAALKSVIKTIDSLNEKMLDINVSRPSLDEVFEYFEEQ